jgi:hypothetical protein
MFITLHAHDRADYIYGFYVVIRIKTKYFCADHSNIIVTVMWCFLGVKDSFFKPY